MVLYPNTLDLEDQKIIRLEVEEDQVISLFRFSIDKILNTEDKKNIKFVAKEIFETPPKNDAEINFLLEKLNHVTGGEYNFKEISCSVSKITGGLLEKPVIKIGESPYGDGKEELEIGFIAEN